MIMDIVWQIVTVIAVILGSMILHELMHGLVAYALGDDTAKLQGRLTLNPIKHIDPFMTIILPVILAISGGPIFGGAKPVPFNPNRLRYSEWGVALVAISGPLTNLLIAFVSFGIFTVSGVSAGSTLGQILMMVVIVNIGFFVFNMIPVPPLDGSRVLYAFAPDFVRRGMIALERSGGIFIVLLIVLLASGFIGTFMNAAIGGILRLFIQIFA